MNKRTEVVVKLRWIADAIACNPKGRCDFHESRFCAGCGCCQLAKAYIDAKRKAKQKP